MGTLFVDKLDPQSGTSLEIGSNGDTITIPSGCTITNNGTATNFGDTNHYATTGFAVKMNGDQSVSHNTDAIVEFDTESIDLGNNFNTSTYKYTVPSAGYYLFTANLHIASDSDGLLKTSSMWMRFTASGGGNTDLILSAKDNESSRQRRMIHSCTYVRQCAAGDTAYVYGYGNVASGGVTFLYSSNNFENMFQGYRVY